MRVLLDRGVRLPHALHNLVESEWPHAISEGIEVGRVHGAHVVVEVAAARTVGHKKSPRDRSDLGGFSV
jgi:hypothetical protein